MLAFEANVIRNASCMHANGISPSSKLAALQLARVEVVRSATLSSWLSSSIDKVAINIVKSRDLRNALFLKASFFIE